MSQARIVLHQEPGCLVLLQESYCPKCGDPAHDLEWPATAHVGIGLVEFPAFTSRDPIERARRDVRNGEACSRYPVVAVCPRSHDWKTNVRAEFVPAPKEVTP